MRKMKGSYANTPMSKMALGMGRKGKKSFPKMKTVMAKKGSGKGLYGSAKSTWMGGK